MTDSALSPLHELAERQPEAGTALCLSGGGVYDNLGLETAWKRYYTLLVNDGGAHFQSQPNPHHHWARHSYRVLDLIDSQVRTLRGRQLVTLFKSRERKGCYWAMRQLYLNRPAEAPNGRDCRARSDTEPASDHGRIGRGAADRLGLCRLRCIAARLFQSRICRTQGFVVSGSRHLMHTMSALSAT